MRGSHGAVYDTIGAGYAAMRRPDPRLFRAIEAALGPGESVLNIGAGSGSYEPEDRLVVALDPSRRMIAQRPPKAAPAIVGLAEALPVADDAVDSAMAVLSVQHWADVTAGIGELVRTSRKTVVLVTMDVDVFASHWMVTDYAPEILDVHASQFPPVERLMETLPSAELTRWEVPRDCTDWFMAALWSRPELYLRPDVRVASSVWHQLPPETVDAAITRLEHDLATGAWDDRHGVLRTASAFDVGVRIVRAAIASGPAEPG